MSHQLNDQIEEAKRLLGENNADGALRVLKPYRKSLKSTNSSHIELHQAFVEAYLENGQLERAYPLLVKACELDPQGQIGGSDKFFTLGQIAGGSDGLALITQGIENLSGQAGDYLKQEQAEKIVAGLLSMVEIWMTDLCMEPGAEAQCEELVSKAMEVSEEKSPEAWAALGSMRISQQRFPEAAEAFGRSWHFFQAKKSAFESEVQQGSGNTHTEFANMLQPLLNLAKMCIEMGLYEWALEIEAAVKDIDEDNLESLYLEAFTHYLTCKLELFKLQNPQVEVNPGNVYEFNQHFQELPFVNANELIQEHGQEARLILTYMVKLAENGDQNDEVVKELVSGAMEVLSELGGPADIKDVIRYRKGEEIGDEEEIEIDIEGCNQA
ncbi:LAME_0G11452g1_1 [Lachancea meyersii CBS 8951]|uniref:LAME_0G11452g1_1 n=1 Tax=Lachancea meyersii CBS 8951 TaxID=1266667 RepID=A0A1G4K9I7_9SACH|nr:LAME_0G11452g1_1 [Lachancea meyersii CBS 8951]